MLNIDSDSYMGLTDTEKEVLHYILDNSKFVETSTSNKIAEINNVSKTVVINLSQKIGFSGFNELKYYLKNNRVRKSKHVEEDLDLNILTNLKQTQILKQEDSYDEAVNSIINSDTVYVMGRGSSKHIAQYLAHNLMTLKIKTFPILDFSHFDVIVHSMNDNDLLIAISLSGETSIIVNTAKSANLKKRNILSITGFNNNRLSKYSKTNLYFLSDNYDTKTDDTTPRTPLMYIIDILSSKVRCKLNQKALHSDDGIEWKIEDRD